MRIIPALLALLPLFPAAAYAHDGHSHGSHSSAFAGGGPGGAANVSRTITIVATDSTFSPARVSVKDGETIKFVVRNEGKLVHELTIGTRDMQAEHQREMLGFAVSGAIEADRVDRSKIGAHSHGNNVLLEPGEAGEVIWTFAKTAELEFGCNVPGHYESGMKGNFSFE